ncbi:MAG: hypothetical protein K2J27_07880 [Duncaniella sp.]|nr:hypothetical protein [Duncaniella sp.]
MKITAADIEDEDFYTINSPEGFHSRLNHDDVRLSEDLPIVVRYDYIDLDATPYHFHQVFTHEDTKGYFKKMKEFAGKSINRIIGESDKEGHFHRSELKGNVRREIAKILPQALNTDQIIYHFALYDTDRWADRKSDTRVSRVYFMLGTYGHIYILFFDPYHELNPLPKLTH